MKDTLISLALLIAILGGSAVFTQFFTRKMYNRCRKCGALNAKRRSQCRVCGEPVG
jgi:hypothetical protein